MKHCDEDFECNAPCLSGNKKFLLLFSTHDEYLRAQWLQPLVVANHRHMGEVRPLFRSGGLLAHFR